MKKLAFQVTFLSDVVLPASSNTEGNVVYLDFIPGSNFLGMAAKHYGEFTNSFDLFHSGKVRFGDAHLLVNNTVTYKMPLSYFHEKLDDSTLYNHHLIEDFTSFKQLKQKRVGYITSDNDLVYIDHNYTQKSAYDKEHRRSKEGSMFGYQALQAGTKWYFTIRYSEDTSSEDIALLKKYLVGTQRLGKSKSAQYGLVEITAVEPIKEQDINDKSADMALLYLRSRVALLDENGFVTLDPRYLAKDLKIDYGKTQIKTTSFTPYNGAMQTKSYEKVCLEKGSVIVVENLTSSQKEEIERGVGAYLSEGFGEVLINPSFLQKTRFSLKKITRENVQSQEKEPVTDLAKFLKQKKQKRDEKLKILQEVDAFIAKHGSLYRNIKPSQWGKIRSICTAGELNFKEEIREYISNGTKKWENDQIGRLLDNEHGLEFIKLLSIQMPKQGGEK